MNSFALGWRPPACNHLEQEVDPASLLRAGIPAEVLGLVDFDDPDFEYIVDWITRMRRSWRDTRDPAVVSDAIKLARRSAEDDRRKAMDGTAVKEEERRRRRLAATVKTVPEFVYYFRIGDRVKIGYTTNLKKRIQCLSPEEVLAAEPGGRGLERQRHRQFRHLHSHNEWFRYERDLVQHVQELKACHAEPQ